VRDFVLLMAGRAAGVLKNALSASLGSVADAGRGRVGVECNRLASEEIFVAVNHSPSPRGVQALGMRDRDVNRPSEPDPSRRLAVNFGATAGDFVLGLEHEHDTAASADESIAARRRRAARRVSDPSASDNARMPANGRMASTLPSSAPTTNIRFCLPSAEIVVGKSQRVRRRRARDAKPQDEPLILK